MKFFLCTLLLSGGLLCAEEMKEFFPDELLVDKGIFPNTPSTADLPENEPDFPEPSTDSDRLTPQTDDGSQSGGSTTPQRKPGAPTSPNGY